MDSSYIALDEDAQRQQYYRNLVKAKIEATYPIEKQLNLLSSDSASDKQAMRRFIDACRAWSNQADPILVDLDAIQP